MVAKGSDLGSVGRKVGYGMVGFEDDDGFRSVESSLDRRALPFISNVRY